jgi:hypothetical protein
MHYGRAPDLTGLGAFFFGLENSPLGHLAGRGTESSNPICSSGESCKPSVPQPANGVGDRKAPLQGRPDQPTSPTPRRREALVVALYGAAWVPAVAGRAARRRFHQRNVLSSGGSRVLMSFGIRCATAECEDDEGSPGKSDRRCRTARVRPPQSVEGLVFRQVPTIAQHQDRRE